MPQTRPASPQPVTAQRTRDAIFVVVSVEDRPQALEAVRRACGAVAGLVRAIGTRDPSARLTCVIGIGSDFWDRLVGGSRPAGLHLFSEVRRGLRHAVSTPGDLLFHIQAERQDFCFELASQCMHILGSTVHVEDEIHGFRYFDDRDLTGFVDGTENPVGEDAVEATIIGDEDPDFAGGSYVLVQKYLHQLSSWDALPTEAQEMIIGRQKLSDIELDDATKPPWAHNALTNIVEGGVEQKILRHNMPFGNAGGGDAGTYFIGYARSPRPLETMIDHMFIGDPPGTYDRLLDFTKAVTGTLFFVPSGAALEALGG